MMSRFALSIDIDRGLVEHGRVHLRSDEALPDEAVKLQLIFGQEFFERLRRTQYRGGPDGFMGILASFFVL